MDWILLFSYIVTATLLIITPGPVVLMLTTTTLQYGSRTALLYLLGTNLASLVLMMATVCLLSGIISLDGVYLYSLGALGSVYLCYLALQGFLSNAVVESAQLKVKRHTGWVSGFMIGIANAKDILFFVALFPQFIAITPSFQHSVVYLACIWIIFDLTLLSGLIWCIDKSQLPLSPKKIGFLSNIILLITGTAGIMINMRLLIPMVV